jgi:hypothetical protein
MLAEREQRQYSLVNGYGPASATTATKITSDCTDAHPRQRPTNAWAGSTIKAGV